MFLIIDLAKERVFHPLALFFVLFPQFLDEPFCVLQLDIRVLHFLSRALNLRRGFGGLLLGTLNFGGSGLLDALVQLLYFRVLLLQLANLPVGCHHHVSVLGLSAM
jgi:hypothetical protein